MRKPDFFYMQKQGADQLCGNRQAVFEKKIFENGCHIHVYSPGTRADNPLGSNFFNDTFSQSFESVAACFPQ